MNQGKVLLNVAVNENNYTIYLNKENVLNAFAVNQEKGVYFVKNEEEIDFLNKIISSLNKRYIRRKNVIFEGQELARFENKYNHFSYFAKMQDDGTFKECEYDNYKDLYKEYNGIQIRILEKKGTTPIDPFEDFNAAEGYEGFNVFEEPINAAELRKKRELNGLTKKIIIGVAGAIATVTLTFAGWNLLKKEKLPEVSTSSEIVLETETEESTKYNEDDPQTLFEPGVDNVADSEEKSLLQVKYKSIEEQLRKAGLQNWEIAQELDHIAIIQNSDERINFYYDTDKDEIVYIYDKVIEAQPKDAKSSDELKDVVYSEEVQTIIDAINSNLNLSDEYKRYIIDTYGAIWEKNRDFINPYELAARYGALTIEFSYKENGQTIESKYNPTDSAAGIYSHAGQLVSTPKELRKVDPKNKLSKLTIFDSHDLAEAQENAIKTQTLNHELNHINGDFSYYGATLLNEGYTQLSSPTKDFLRYKNEQIMNIIFIETFGADTIKEGYYGFDLEQAITNKMVEKTGKDANVVRNEMYELLSATQELLYDLDDRGYNEDLAKRMESYLGIMSDYYSQVNGQDMSKNQIVNMAIDYLTGSHKANLYSSPEETVLGLKEYDVDTGRVIFDLGKSHEDVSFTQNGIITTSNFTSKRKVELDNSNKYNEDLAKVEDKDIEYWSR